MNIIFYIMCFIFLGYSITGNVEMKDQIFQGIVILGFCGMFNLLRKIK